MRINRATVVWPRQYSGLKRGERRRETDSSARHDGQNIPCLVTRKSHVRPPGKVDMNGRGHVVVPARSAGAYEIYRESQSISPNRMYDTVDERVTDAVVFSRPFAAELSGQTS